MKLKDTTINQIEVELDLNPNIYVHIIDTVNFDKLEKRMKGFSKKYKSKGIGKNVLVYLNKSKGIKDRIH